jgi:agmatine deiminase
MNAIGRMIMTAALLLLAGGLSLATDKPDLPKPGTRGPLLIWDANEPRPPLDPSQPLVPFAVNRPTSRDAVPSSLIASPPEYEPVEGILFRYKKNEWHDIVADIVGQLTGDPAHDEIAYVVVGGSSDQSHAEGKFTNAGADLSKVEFITMPNDSIWMRDYGPHFIWQDGARAVVDSHYYTVRDQDNFIPTLLADEYFLVPSYDIGLRYSGGNFQPGPARSAFVTALIFTSENPGFTVDFVEELYNTYKGIDTLHIFPRLPTYVDATSHIDMWFYLVDDHTVIISEFDPGQDATAITITNNAAAYMETELGFDVFRTPDIVRPDGGTDVHYTYTNAFRVNDRIFISSFGDGDSFFDSRDAAALATWQAAAPDAEIVVIPSFDLIWAAGGIHCIVKQIPRYTDPAPSASMVTPTGGELLVHGTTHDVQWTATDDQQVTSVDLLYSTNGGASFDGTIALGESNDGHFDWPVPTIETEQALVKVVARDAVANQDETLSTSALTIREATQHVYDFSNGAGIDKWAWGFETLDWTLLDGIRHPSVVNTEISGLETGAYGKIAVSDATGNDTDANRYIAPKPETNSEATHIFEFTIDEDPSIILDLKLLWEGYGEFCQQMELYIWDYVSGDWCNGRGQCGERRYVDNETGNQDIELSGHVRSDFSRYINETGQLTVLVYEERYRRISFHDYISVTVTYDTCSGPPDLDGDMVGDSCDCAPGDGTVFATPAEIQNLIVADTTTLGWDSDTVNSGSGTLYAVLRGNLAELPVGSGAAETCLDAGMTDQSLSGLLDPPSGSGFYYVVRGVNSCDAGVYGFDSNDIERNSDTCP